MEINSVWNTRLKEFYFEIVKYFSLIAMGVFYSFIIFGSVFLYYYMEFLQWLPPFFPTEVIASLVITFTFLKTGVRTFVKKADVVFLMPAETALSSYFKKSMFYSAFIDVFKLLIMLLIISPLVKQSEIITMTLLITFSGLILLNIRLIWIEQWMTTKLHKLIHTGIRFLTFYTIIYFIFIGLWTIAGTLLIINCFLWFYVFNKKARGINWDYLINQEEKSLFKIYKFINLYIDVPHLKHSFKRRKFLGWSIKKGITYKHTSAYTYLFSHLFIRYNEFFYLYARLTLIGISISFFFPAYGWFVAFPLLFLTGYQLLPLQYSINDSSRIYPVSTKIIKESFQKLLLSLLLVQLLFFNLASISPIFHIKFVSIIFMELLVIYWFVYIFASKRIMKQPE
ncbi:ABC transporter permease [Sporosarcina sp. ANT_H38]|uniref:ABC transporter permease n=1 Tax=Sporosarcina sp. ANT_H38 TaxID=2597358 RepID=UPI0011F34762|nr:ABC transporter permease [Sporosarcina sp. ANT_H38]